MNSLVKYVAEIQQKVKAVEWLAHHCNKKEWNN